MSVFRGADLVGVNYPDREAFNIANAPTQIFVDTLKSLRSSLDGAVTHTNAAVGGSFDNEVPQQYAGAAGKPFDLVFLGLAMNSGSMYGVHGRGPNAAFTKGVLQTFIREAKASGAKPIVCNTVHPWPEKFDPVATNAALYEGIAYPPDRATLYASLTVTVDAEKSTLTIGGLDASGAGFFERAGPGAYIRTGSQLRLRYDGGTPDGDLVTVVANLDGSTVRVQPGEISRSGSVVAFVQHVYPDTEKILDVPPSKQRQFRDWTGSGVGVDGLFSYFTWNSILRQICEEEQVPLLDLEYRGFRWAERYGWPSVYTSTYQGVPFATVNHPQIAAQRVIYGDLMRELARRVNADDLKSGFELIRGPAI